MEQHIDKLLEQLIRHEGMELKPYKCTSDKLTIGVGRNLQDVGITKEEALVLLENDVKNVEQQLKHYMPWSETLDPVRRAALINFVFNVGIGTALKFENAMAALKQSDYDIAAAELLNSRWSTQVGSRAQELAAQMRTGSWQ
jgi:lysozyme